jgi:hypothetical protein
MIPDFKGHHFVQRREQKPERYLCEECEMTAGRQPGDLFHFSDGTGIISEVSSEVPLERSHIPVCK